MGGGPSASIPGACNARTGTQAAYRLFDQAWDDKRGVGWEDVLARHLARTETRMAAHPVALCLQDTTELDFNGQDMDGLGRKSPFPLRRFPSRTLKTLPRPLKFLL